MKRSTVALLTLGAAGLALVRLLRPRYSFASKVVVITGGSRGLGLAMARRFAAEGASLALLARDRGELDRACEDLRHRGARAILPIPCDVRDEAQLQSAMAVAASLWGRIDVLVNNAGLITVGPLHTMTNRDFEEAFALHFWAPLYAIQAALPHMRCAGEGRVVNISSFGGKFSVPHLAPYCASKFALVGLSDALRAELAEESIKVTTVCPGLMRTGSHLNAFFKGAYEEEFAWFAAGATLPGSAIRADKAARKIVEACREGRPELIITLQAKLAVIAQALLPNTMARVTALVNRFLPHSRTSQRRMSGWESRGKVSPGFTRRADRATEDLNGLRGHSGVAFRVVRSQ